MSALAVKVAGANALAARLRALPPLVRAVLAQTLEGLSDDLYELVEEKLDGGVLRQRSGRLASAITRTAATSANRVKAAVGLDLGIAPYGAAQEFGASVRAQLIEAKNGQALAFLVGGRKVFATHVMHPAFTLPERSFLRSSLGEMEPAITTAIADGVAAAVMP